MIRLLHLHDRDADFQTRRAVEQLGGNLGREFESTALPMPAGGALGKLARAVFRLRRTGAHTDILHAWGMRALSAAALGPIERIVFTPTEFPTRRQVKWLRAIMTYRNAQVICPTATIERQLIGRGIPEAKVHLVRPGVDFALVRKRRDPQLRAALGFADQHQVLLAVGESTRHANHAQAVWASAILNVADRNTRLLLWGRGPMARRAAEFASKLAEPELVVLAQSKLGRRMEFEDLLPAADMLLISATGPVATLPIAIAMAAALPIISTVTPTAAELLEDRHTALMTPPAVPRLLAQRILHMRADSSLQWSLADRARTEAYDYFPLTRFLQQMQEIYGKIAAKS
jgi:glycosyltransferase involved in cell wall biosynthesis